MAKAPRKIRADITALTDEEIAKVKAEARAQVEAEIKRQQMEALLSDEKDSLYRRIDPDEELVPLRIDLPPFADRLTLDGVIYLHGWTGELPKSVYLSVQDAVARSWTHQVEIEGHAKEYRRARGLQVRAGDEAVGARSLMRRV